MKNSGPIFCDLKLDATLLTESETKELLEASVKDGFSVLAVNKSWTFGTPLPSFPSLSGFNPRVVLILKRLTVKISSDKEIPQMKGLAEKLSKAVDLVAFEFADADLLETFLKNIDFPGDNLISLDLKAFTPPKSSFKTLKSRPYYLEVSYGSILDPLERKKSIVNFFRVMESHFDKVVLSSGASSNFERRNTREVREVVRGLMDVSDEQGKKLFEEICAKFPAEVVKRARLARDGFAKLVEQVPAPKQ